MKYNFITPTYLHFLTFSDKSSTLKLKIAFQALFVHCRVSSHDKYEPKSMDVEIPRKEITLRLVHEN